MSLQLHLDECVSGAVAEGLRRRGVDLTTANSARLTSATDEKHLEYATASGRVVFTQDDDFLAIARSYGDHGGIIYAHQNRYSIGELIESLVIAVECIAANEVRGRVEYL